MSESPGTHLQTDESQDQPVLVAVDFSDDAKAALLWACRFAECVESEVVILHVVHDPASLPGFYRLKDQDKLQPMQSVAHSMMADFMEEIKRENPDLKGLQSAEARFVDGLPPGRIIEMADLLRARLIVIGSRGLTGLPHLMLGSVAERVVEMAPQPVVVVKAAGRKSRKKLKKEQKKLRKNLKEKLKKQAAFDG